MLTGLVKDLNETTRCFALALGDPYQGREVGEGMGTGDPAGDEAAQQPERRRDPGLARRIGDGDAGPGRSRPRRRPGAVGVGPRPRPLGGRTRARPGRG
jgi:hypothetical protein